MIRPGSLTACPWRLLSYWVSVTFQGQPVKLREGNGFIFSNIFMKIIQEILENHHHQVPSFLLKKHFRKQIATPDFFFQTTLNVMFQPQLARQTPKIHPAFYHLKKKPPLDRKNNVTHPSRVWHVPAFQYATNERARDSPADWKPTRR